MSAIVTLTLWRFAGASVISIAVAALLYALLALAARRWPALAAHRSPWLLAQGAVVAAFALALQPPALPGGPLITVRSEALVLALAPTDDAMSAAPGLNASAMPTTTDAMAPARDAAQRASRAHAIESATTGASATTVTNASATTNDATTTSVIAPVPTASLQRALASAVSWLGAAWLLVYAAGLLWLGAHSARNHRRWQTLLNTAQRLDIATLRQHGAFSSTQLAQMRERALAVLETPAPISPMLIGALHPRLVLPTSLHGLSDTQQALIVAHELTHWRRRDTLWLAVSGTLQAVFWFNAPLRWFGQRLHWAVELGCDNAVLAGRTPHERHNYAAALIAQLRQQHAAHAGVPAFGALAVRERIERMRSAATMRLPAAGALALATAGAAIVAVSVVLQPAFAARASVATPAATRPHSAPAWHYPLDQVTVSSLYGVVSPRVPQGHHGIDFKARRGTPVQAVAAGTVIESSSDARYGNYVRIDHGDGRQSLLIHLDSSAVRSGEVVQAGQRIGAAGSTGMASGPHLHLEYWQDGQRRDPTLMFPDLDTHASAAALARRAAQQPRAG